MTDERDPDVSMKAVEEKKGRPKRKSRKSHSPQKRAGPGHRRPQRPSAEPTTLDYNSILKLLQDKWAVEAGKHVMPTVVPTLLQEELKTIARFMANPLVRGQTGDIRTAAVGRLRSLQSGVITDRHLKSIRVDASDLLFEEG